MRLGGGEESATRRGEAGRGSACTGRALLVALVCSVGCVLSFAPAALAIPNDTDGDPGPPDPQCTASAEEAAQEFTLEGNLVVVGVPLARSPFRIEATSAKLVGRLPTTSTTFCPKRLFQVAKFRWSVAAAPAGQSASFVNGTTLSPTVNLGGPGTYRIALTACPSTCRLTFGGKSVTVGPRTLTLTVEALSQYVVPPESQPLLPTLAAATNPPPTFGDAARDRACQGGGGAKDPQWVTAEPFRGAGDYRLVEGSVVVAKVARQDDFLNHDSQDFNWDVKPDLPYAGLLQPSSAREMEMEWETGAYPSEFRPTAGDRASTVGYWIFDCGHDGFLTEIHPPVGVATARPRAVDIPSTFRPPGFPGGMGTNVKVPGISTDIVFNRKAGGLTNDCGFTGLHQQPGSNGDISGACIREPNPVNRTFTFNVYLPRDPQQRARDVGLTPPPVPLFVESSRPGGGGPDPTWVVRQLNGVTWLEVTVDLRNFTGTTYKRRLSAAWAYPQPANWGAKRWTIDLKKIRVYDDAEIAGDDGDWRMYFNTNNRDREWTQVIPDSCEGCVDDDTDYRLNFQTGTAGLGADPVLFPGQRILVHTGGFDEEAFADDIGTVNDYRLQSTRTYSTDSQGDEGSYRLDYAIRPGPAVVGATLTPEARSLAAAYTANAPTPCTFSLSPTRAAGDQTPARACPVVSPAARDPNLTRPASEDNLVLTKPVQNADDLPAYEHEDEPYTLNGISLAKLRVMLDTLRKKEPQRLDALLAEMRRKLARVPVRLRGDYYELVGALDKSLPKSLVDRALPPGFRKRLRPFPFRP